LSFGNDENRLQFKNLRRMLQQFCQLLAFRGRHWASPSLTLRYAQRVIQPSAVIGLRRHWPLRYAQRVIQPSAVIGLRRH